MAKGGFVRTIICATVLTALNTVSIAQEATEAVTAMPQEQTNLPQQETSSEATEAASQPAAITEQVMETSKEEVPAVVAEPEKQEVPAENPPAEIVSKEEEIRVPEFSAEQLQQIEKIENEAETYLYGDGVKEDLSKAAALYAEASVLGSPKAKMRLSTMYRQGQGVSKDLKKAFELALEAAQAGFAQAQSTLSNYYQNGIGTEKNEEKAKFWLGKAAESGHHISQVLYALMVENAGGNPADTEKAEQYLREVEENASPQELYSIAYSFFHGLRVPKDRKKAMEWAKLGAEKGQVHAMYLLGACYWEDKEYKQATEWFKKAAEHGLKAAQLQTGRLMRDGAEGVEKNPVEAVRWLEQASSLGNADDILSLLILRETGSRSVRDHKKAQEWLTIYVAEAPAEQLNALAKKYWEGDGVRRNFNLGGAFALAALKKGSTEDVCGFAEKLGTKNWKRADFITAYSLLNQCVIDHADNEHLKNVFKGLHNNMSAEQIEKAQELDPTDALRDYLEKNSPKLN